MKKLLLLSGLLGMLFVGCAKETPAPAPGPAPEPSAPADADKKDAVDTPATPAPGDAAPAAADPGKAP